MNQNAKHAVTGFPPYMGFGKLRKETVTENGEIITAAYYLEDRPVHQITFYKAVPRWEIRDIFDEKGLLTSNSDFDKAVTDHFWHFDPESSGALKYLQQRVCSLGNIWFEPLQSKKEYVTVSCHSPAGRMVMLRIPLPLDEQGEVDLDKIPEQTPYSDERNGLLCKIFDSYASSIIVYDKDDNATVVPVVMVEIVAELAWVIDIVEWLTQVNVISGEKLFQMIIHDAGKYSYTSKEFIDGTPEDPFEYYMVILKAGGDYEQFMFVHEMVVAVAKLPGRK